MFKPSNFLMKSLNAHPQDRFDIISALIGYINADQAFETDNFNNAVEYALHHGISYNELFQSYDTSENKIEEDRSKWDDSYYALAKVYLKVNFCQERINHCKEVAHYLYPHGFKNQAKSPSLKYNAQSAPVKQGKTLDHDEKKVQDQHYSHKPNPATSKPNHSMPILAIVVICLVVLILGLYWVLKK